MSKIDRDLRKFVTALIKYAANSTEFPIEFTADEIPKIFNNWTKRDFNLVYNGAGKECCFYTGFNRLQINIAHCKSLHGKLKGSRRGTYLLLIAILALIAGIVFGILNYKNDHNKANKNDNKTSGVLIHN